MEGFVQVLLNILDLSELLQIQNKVVHVFSYHCVVRFEGLAREQISGVDPAGKGPGVKKYYFFEIPVEQAEVLCENVDVLFFVYDFVAVLLVEDMLDFALGVDVLHHHLHVFRDALRENDGLELLAGICQEVGHIFAEVNAQKGLIIVQLVVYIVVPQGSSQVALLIRGEGVCQELIDFHHQAQFVAAGGGQQFGLALIALPDFLDEVLDVGLVLEIAQDVPLDFESVLPEKATKFVELSAAIRIHIFIMLFNSGY